LHETFVFVRYDVVKKPRIVVEVVAVLVTTRDRFVYGITFGLSVHSGRLPCRGGPHHPNEQQEHFLHEDDEEKPSIRTP
jgi:hypothetical protein